MKDKKNFFSEWLEKLQQESWQLELLISGFAILGLFSFRNYLDEVASEIINSGEELSVIVLILLLMVLYGGTVIFIINLLIHILVRGLWIGAIGLRYVSGDIEYDKLKYNDRFLTYFKRTVGSFDSYIEKLEKFASVIFSYTFLLFFMFLSFFLFLIVMLVTMGLFTHFFKVETGASGNLSMTMKPALFVLAICHLVCGALVAIDFVTLGLLKRIKQRHFSFVYFWIFRYVSFISLSFLWRPLLLNFLDAKFTKTLFILAIPYIVFISAFVPSFVLIGSAYYPELEHVKNPTKYGSVFNKHMYNPIFYDDELDKFPDQSDRIGLFSIPSKRVSGPLFEVFIKRHGSDEKLVPRMDSTLVPIRNKGLVNRIFTDVGYETEAATLKSDSFYLGRDSLKKVHKKAMKTVENPDELNEQWILERAATKRAFKKQELLDYEQNFNAIKKILTESFHIKINNQLVPRDQLDCDYFIHPNKQEKGMLCFFPLDSIRLGRNLLTVEKLIPLDNSKTGIDTLSFTIPFVYEGL